MRLKPRSMISFTISSTVASVSTATMSVRGVMISPTRRPAGDGARRQVEDAGDAAEEQLEGAHEGREAQAPALRVARHQRAQHRLQQPHEGDGADDDADDELPAVPLFARDRKSTRLNSSHS